ncbi:enoyl-CoA hydratase/isomerase family protein [Gottfriedia acidiceleris]|uniref:enoyl-CoA hydratase/isomerase family protein n=1 Tax=Gottfriedia acidiceleris TaxID=371036 RepID=UPI003D210A23
MSVEDLLVCTSFLDGRIVLLSLNRPKQLNALNREMIQSLSNELNRLSEDSAVEILVIGSQLNKAFCSGVDVHYLQSLSNEDAAEFFADLAGLLEIVIRFKCPTIAAVTGYVYGAGADLALACDFRIAGESAKFRFPGSQFGVVLGTRRLIHEVGPARSRLLTLTGRTLDSMGALDFEIAHQVVEDSECFSTALSLAEQIIQIPANGLHTIKNLCRNFGDSSEYNSTISVRLAKESILAGDFKKSLQSYLDRGINKQTTNVNSSRIRYTRNNY